MFYSAVFYTHRILRRVSKEGVSSEEKAKKKWIVHVKICKSRGDRLRIVGRNSILKGVTSVPVLTGRRFQSFIVLMKKLFQ